MEWKFIHAADLHLDSPLRGLQAYDGAPAEQIRGASRVALTNLVTLCLAEEARFLLISGDVFDGDWKDHSTGLFFAKEMSRLRRENIPVFLVNGNHDAESQVRDKLKMPDNLNWFSTRKPESFPIDDLNVVIHGQGFKNRAVIDNLVHSYPAARGDWINIGLLHTSATGREGHENYAPCTVTDMEDKGYSYWALGHIHTKWELAQEPWILFPGNLQGRHSRETGPKGCAVVTVQDDQIRSVEHVALHVMRWEVCNVAAVESKSRDDALDAVRIAVENHLDNDQGLLAIRVVLEGETCAHYDIAKDMDLWVSDCRALANDHFDGQVWIEKVKIKTSPPKVNVPGGDGALDSLWTRLDELKRQPDVHRDLAGHLKDLKLKVGSKLLAGPEPIDLESAGLYREVLREVEELLRLRLSE